MRAAARQRNGIGAPELGRMQRWMQACIMAEGPVEQAIETPAAVLEFPVSRAPGLIRASRTLAPLERLDIYRGMYELRLVEALKVDYPGLRKLWGEETFEELARLYVAEHPSKSYTLNRLGDRLPEFVPRVEGLPKARFAWDLARLELAETLVFDEEESPVAEAGAIAGITEEQWGRLRFHPARAMRMLRLHYPAHEYMQAVRRDETPVVPRPRRTNLIVYRRDFALLHLPVAAPGYALFEALAQGCTLAEGMESMQAAGAGSAKQVFDYFRVWFGERLFARVEIQ
ncbi:MAG TPA: hypothetical protein DEH78_05175 [Solibacterales bacterium]|nr:hypothetical protein [Bryobacterales bacterium]